LVGGNPVARFGPGDFFGEVALFDARPRYATVVADRPAELIVLDSDESERLARASPRLARASPGISQKLLVALARRARENASARAATRSAPLPEPGTGTGGVAVDLEDT
jgi:CRP-like cAMP-binding protein